MTPQSCRTSNLRYTKIGTSMKGTSWNTGASGDTDGVHNILFLKRQEAETPHHAQPPKAFNQLFSIQAFC